MTPPSYDPTEPLISLRDVCARLGRSRASIYRDIAAGRFPAPLKVNHSSRWLASDLASFISGRADARA